MNPVEKTNEDDAAVVQVRGELAFIHREFTHTPGMALGVLPDPGQTTHNRMILVRLATDVLDGWANRVIPEYRGNHEWAFKIEPGAFHVESGIDGHPIPPLRVLSSDNPQELVLALNLILGYHVG